MAQIGSEQRRSGGNERQGCATTLVQDGYELRTRSIRIHGVVTSVGLENFCWEILSRIASQHALTANQQVVKLHDDYAGGRTGAVSFSSFLRIYCMQFLAHAVEHRDDATVFS